MSVKNMNKFKLAVVVSGLLSVPVVQATNGYFAHGYSTKEKGLAGAGVAYSQDSLAAANNPAGMAFVGERMDLGLALFSPSDRSYTATGTPPPIGAPGGSFSVNPGSITSENDIFLIPSFGYNWVLDTKSTMGISVYGNGGMDTEYEGGSARATNPGTGLLEDFSGTLGAGTVGINLSQLFFNFSYAYKLDAKQAVGASIILAAQRFRAFGMAGFGGFSNDPSNLSGNRNSDSTGFGFKLGYQGEVIDNLTFGVSYQSEVSMSEFDEYKGLFAEDGDFDIPSTYTIGLAYDYGKAGKVVLDVQRINYSDIDAIANPVQNLFTCSPPAASCLGGSNGGGFGWEDMTIVKLGYELESEGNTYRFGYSKGDQPIPGGSLLESQTLFNILAPAVIEQHFTFGMTMPVGKDQEFNLAVMFAPNQSVSGANPFDGGATQIELEMEQKEIQVGWSWKY